MSKLISKGLAALALLGGTAAVHGFSLLGPFEAWQTGGIGYNPGGSSLSWSAEGDAGAPKAVGGEFRISEPIFTYAYDATFLDYFGEDGIRAVESAIKVFNDLPSASSMSADLSEFPLATSRVNYAAQRLNLYDVKTVVMGLILEEMGVASPERYVWTIRQNNPDQNGAPQFLNVRRNFDPVTQLATSFVNNTLYTYHNVAFLNPDGSVLYYDAEEVSLDAAEPNVSLAAYTGTQVSTVDGRVSTQVSRSSFGRYYTGLTRDDAGALRYMYHPNNKNYEPITPTTTLRTSQNVTVIGTGSGGSWGGLTPALGVSSGGTTNSVAAIGDGVRGGIDKITFIRVDVDPLLNRFLKPLVLRYTDTVTTNGVTRSQQVERSLGVPHVTFRSQDIGTFPAPFRPVPWVYGRPSLLVATAAPVGPNGSPKDPAAGPGIIENATQGALFDFNNIGPGLINRLGGTEERGTATFVWGSFDGSTNRPVVYPKGLVTLEDIANASYGGN